MPDFVAGGGERLDVALGAHVGSRSAAARLIDAGLVTVDGAAAPKRRALRGGELVQWEPEPEIEEEPRPAATFSVAYEDEHLMIVDKPAGVVVHPAKGHRQGTLAQALEGKAAGGDDPWRAGIVHRLDRDTSGLLLVATTEAAYETLRGMLKRREVTREYLALVDGRPSARRGTIEAPIGRDRRVRTLISTDTDAPRDAVTHFAVEDALETSTLLRVRLQTGRTHQIRAHLKAIGHPVCGDPDYGKPGVFGLTRQFLHAERLALEHPITGEPLEARSALPADLQAALSAARAG